MNFSLNALGRMLREDRGAAFFPQLIIAVVMLSVTSTALVRNIWEAHESSQRSYRRMRALEELQNEVEYWKAEVYVRGSQHPFPRANRVVVIEDGKRGRNDVVLAEFDPQPTISQFGTGTSPFYEITVSIAWPEGGVIHRESIKTAINQVR
jgi:hypothetical protein